MSSFLGLCVCPCYVVIVVGDVARFRVVFRSLVWWIQESVRAERCVFVLLGREGEVIVAQRGD